MRFDLVDLQVFVAVAEARSITHGAARANLALASVSERIRTLERALDVALLRRGRHGVTLTEAGESLLDHARIVLAAADNLRGDLAGYARGLKTSIRVLANTSSLSEHLPDLLARFLRDHPQVTIDTGEQESVGIAEAIAAGRAEIGIAVDAALPAGIERFAFRDDRLVLAVPAQDDLARRRAIDFSTVVARDFVGLAGASALQVHLATQVARLGARLRFRARLRDFDAVCRLVAAGVGIAVVPEAAARRCARMMPIRTVRIRDPWAMRRLVVCVRDLKALPKPARQLVAHLRGGALGKGG
ncbi:MAG: LysR family transcriptional regulator [Xanthobacteraceae bacterium]|nr:LysR family transcriptional regulator [Xanthobacteraceae bacterium]